MIVPADSEKAFFCIDIYRDGSDEPSSTGATNIVSARAEIERVGRSGNFDFIELYQWIDDVSEWGDPIEEFEPEDFD